MKRLLLVAVLLCGTVGLTTAATISIRFNGDNVSISNPLSTKGVQIQTKGARVDIQTNGVPKGITYRLSGSTTNGGCTLHSDADYTLQLNGVTLTSQGASALTLKGRAKVAVELVDGTQSHLIDSTATSASSEGGKAVCDSKGPLTIEGKGRLFIHSNGAKHHGICSDKGITLNEGQVTVAVSGDRSKGLKCTEDLHLNGGSLSVYASGGTLLSPDGKGFEADYCAAVHSGGSLYENGTTVYVQHSGSGGKAFWAGRDYVQTKGKVVLQTTGDGTTYTNREGQTDAYRATALTTKGNMEIAGGDLEVCCTGRAGNGLQAKGNLILGTKGYPRISVTTSGAAIDTVSEGNGEDMGGFPPFGIEPPFGIASPDSLRNMDFPQDPMAEADFPDFPMDSLGPGGMPPFGNNRTTYASAKAIKAAGFVRIGHCQLVVSSSDDGIKSDSAIVVEEGASISILQSYEGFEAPSIAFLGGQTAVSASNDAINGSMGTVKGGSETNDGSKVRFEGGVVEATCSGMGDVIDSNGDIVLSGGKVILQGPRSAPEVALDYNGTLYVTGGFMIGCGPNAGGMIEPKTASLKASNSQCLMCFNAKQWAGNTLFHLQEAAGDFQVTFRPKIACYYIFLIAPKLQSDKTYTVSTGGTYSTSNQTNGLLEGGSYTDGSLYKTFSIHKKGFESIVF
jgi:hypothetical protein